MKVQEIMEKKILLNLSGFMNKTSRKSCGGGQISNYLLFDRLKKHFEIHILTLDDNLKNGVNYVDGLFYHNKTFKNMKNGWLLNDWRRINFNYNLLREVACKIKPEIIIADREYVGGSFCFAKSYRIKTAVFIRAFENFYKSKYCFFDSINKKVKFNFEKIFYMKKDYDAVKQADLVVVNSKFMKNEVDNIFSVNSKIVYPPIDLCYYQKTVRKIRNNNVGFLKPEYKKGLFIILDIARKLKSLKFFCIGVKPNDWEKFERISPNVEFLGWKDNSKDIYSNLNILLVPSIWPEPFGRVAVEGSASRVLPLVSNRGGLPEAVKPNACIISNVYDVDSWVLRIKQFLNEESYQLALQEQFDYIKTFDVIIQANVLINAIMEVI